MVSKITFSVLCFTCAFLSLAKGGNSDWARAVATMLVVPVFFMNWNAIFEDHKNDVVRIWPWIGVWGAVTATVVFQLMPGLGSLLGGVGGVGGASGIASLDCYEWVDCKTMAITSFPMSSLSHWSMATVYMMAAWLVSRMSSQEIRYLGFFIVVLSVTQVLYGLFAFIVGQDSILWIWKKEFYLQFATGTFVNRNHFSGFIELTWPLMLSVIMLPRKRHGFDLSIGWKYALVLVLSSLFTFAVLGSQSRLGAGSTFIGLVCWLLLMNRRREGKNSRGAKWVVAASLLFLAMSALWFGVDKILYRFINDGFVGRAQVWNSLFELPIGVWITGIGVGNFVDFFQTIQSHQLRGLFRFAHSDILEFVLDYGLIGSSLVVFFAIICVKRNSPDKYSRLQIGALSGVVAIFVHSFGDFNLHIPGVAFTFWVLVGVLLNGKQDQSKKARPKESRSKESRSKREKASQRKPGPTKQDQQRIVQDNSGSLVCGSAHKIFEYLYRVFDWNGKRDALVAP